MKWVVDRELEQALWIINKLKVGLKISATIQLWEWSATSQKYVALRHLIFDVQDIIKNNITKELEANICNDHGPGGPA